MFSEPRRKVNRMNGFTGMNVASPGTLKTLPFSRVYPTIRVHLALTLLERKPFQRRAQENQRNPFGELVLYHTRASIPNIFDERKLSVRGLAATLHMQFATFDEGVVSCDRARATSQHSCTVPRRGNSTRRRLQTEHLPMGRA